MNLNLRIIPDMVNDQISDAQASSPVLVQANTTQGSVLRAVFRAVAGVGAWLQSIALDVLRASRLTSSTGFDVDTWIGDFGLTRLPASKATGQLRFSRFSASSPASIAVGTLVKTGDTTLSFQVVADTSNLRWSLATQGYELPSDTYSLDVPAIAVVAGTNSNVIAGAVSLISASTGMDTVTNPAAFSGGVPAETDEAVKLRFQRYVASLSKATAPAIMSAASSVQQGLKLQVDSNVDTMGTFKPGNFVLTVDDGSGMPPETLLTAIALSIDPYVKAVAETFSVVGPATVIASVNLNIETQAGVDSGLFTFAVQKAVTAYIRGLGIGQKLRFSRIDAIAYNVSGSIINVTNVTVNNAYSDIDPGFRGLVLPGVVTVS